MKSRHHYTAKNRHSREEQPSDAFKTFNELSVHGTIWHDFSEWEKCARLDWHEFSMLVNAVSVGIRRPCMTILSTQYEPIQICWRLLCHTQCLWSVHTPRYSKHNWICQKEFYQFFLTLTLLWSYLIILNHTYVHSSRERSLKCLYQYHRITP